MIKSENKKIEYLLTSLNIVFIAYYVILAIYSRPHYDDLHFLWKMREMSIYDYVMDMYYSRSGRFVAYAINGFVFKTINAIGAHWFFPIVFWCIGVGLSIYSVCKLSKIKFSFIIANLVALFYNIFVLTNIDFAVFNWLCAMSYYILVPVTLALLALILSDKKNIIEYFAIALLSVFLGGGLEAFTPIVLALMFLVLLIVVHKNQYDFSKTARSPLVIKLISSGALMLAVLIIVVIAPGNYNRLAMDEFTTPNSIIAYLKGFTNAITMCLYYISFYLPYYFILALIIFKFAYSKYNIKSIIRKDYLIYSFVAFVIYCILTAFPSVYLWGGFGIQRNYTHLVFVSILFIVYWLQFLFIKLNNSFKQLLNLSTTIGALLLFAIMIGNILLDSKAAHKYASDVDDRIELALKKKKSGLTENLVVKPLTAPLTSDVKYVFFNILGKKSNPQPMLYYISDTGETPNEYASHFRKYYQLNFDIVLKQ